MALRLLTTTVTQSAADTFTAGELATGLSNVNLAFRVRMIEILMPAMAEVDSLVTCQIARRSVTAVLPLTDRRLLWSETNVVKLTTSGLVLQQAIYRVVLPRDLDLLVVEDPLYCAVHSATTSIANVASFRLMGEDVRLTDLQKVSALAESANA